MTPGTVTDKNELISQFEKIRKQGYALDDEGAIIWVKAVAAPIFDVQNNLLAAVSVSVPKIQDQLEKFDSYIEATIKTAEKISKAFYECRLKLNDGPQK
ncbi:putative HTH-type transcriptional regulator RhmR [bioreactor metagenome]|uniref:Putative HTH-type transcriptional regulator RhmR n=1 Tax=bioreactor metagenome TaxID=1076179 RepID=A0A645IPT6_9ZZZZ